MTKRKSVLEDFDAIRQARAEIAQKEHRGCLRCGELQGVELEDSRTQYPFEGELNSDEDPNKPIPLCRSCAKEHHGYWDEMWDEYYRGRL